MEPRWGPKFGQAHVLLDALANRSSTRTACIGSDNNQPGEVRNRASRE
jgi:hypothetical protein